MKKRITALALALVMVLGMAAVAAGEKNITVTPMNMTINGQTVTPTKSDGTPAEVFAYDGATYVPLRYLSELLGIQVDWDATAPNTAKLVGDNLKVPAAGKWNFKAGTYESKVTGHNAAFTVRVTVDEHSILSVEALNDLETRGVGKVALARLPKKIVEKQSVGVDGVTGATVTSWALLNGAKDCLKQAGGDVAALSASVETVNREDKTVSTDVVVVGGGGSGMAAAVSAAQNGAQVVIVEKLDYLGGSTVVSGGAYNAADEQRQSTEKMTPALEKTIEGYLKEDFTDKTVQSWQKTLRTEYEAYKASGNTSLFDSPTLHMIQTYVGGHNVGTPALIEYLCTHSLESLEWLEGLGLEVKDKLGTATGALYQRSHYTKLPAGTGYVELLTDVIEKNDNIQVYYSCPATKLLTDASGKVTGVVCKDGEGTLTVNASRGVILATGGFGSNIKLRQEVNTGVWAEADLGSAIGCSNINPCAQGDGLTLATEVGANLVGMSDIQLHPCGNPVNGLMDAIRTSGRNRLFVNVDGERFVNEGAARDTLCKAIFAQKGSTYWVVVNSVRYPSRDWVDSNGNTIQDMVALGLVIEADTLEELAEKTDMDPNKLKASVEQYNKAVRGEEEDPLGFQVASADVELVEGPWYACKKVPTVHHTMGGVEINTNCEVIGAGAKAIPGLYAAGEVTGGIHGGNRLGGNAIADCFTFGRQAGANAAKNK